MSESMTVPMEPSQVPVPAHAQDDATPTPVERSTPQEEPKAPEPKADKPDLDTALKRAFDRAKADKEAKAPEPKAEEPKAEDKQAKPTETPEAKAERERASDGKFVAKEPKTPEPSAAPADKVDGQDGEPKPRPSEGRDYSKPPAHFLPRAKEAWSSVNPDVQGEVHRMAQNYEKGIAEHKEASERWKELEPFHKEAQAAGTTVSDYIRNVRAIETLLRTNPEDGIRRVLATANITPEQYARHVLQQSEQRAANPALAQTDKLGQTIQQLQQQIKQMEQRDQEREEQARLDAVASRFIEPFKADHPRYDELEQDIAFFLNSGKIPSNLSERERLETAYDMAERINPAPQFSARAPGTPAQTRQLDPAGTKSITGAPTPGLSTTKAPGKEEAKDLDAILRRSLAKVTAAR